MKRLIYILVLAAGSAIGQEFKNLGLDTDITHVKVYLDGAQVTRSGTSTLPAGKSIITITGLTQYLDPNSIQVKGLGDFTILSVNHKINYLKSGKSDQVIDSLNSVLIEITHKTQELNSRLEVLKEKQSLLDINKKLQTSESSITDLQLAMEYYDKELSKIKKEQLEIARSQKELSELRGKIQKQIGNNSGSKRVGEIIVRTEAPKNVKAEFSISYLTSNAGWRPSYDIRAKSINDPVMITYKSNLYQSTGVDWNNVKLSFSNGNPRQGGTAPQLDTWFLNFNNFQNKLYGYSTSGIYGERAPSKAIRGKVSGVAIDKAEEAEILSELVVTQTIENQTTFEIQVSDPYTTKSQGESLSIELKKIELEADYTYYAVPKLDKDAFLMARIVDWDKHNLLQGEANLYFEDAFVGRTILNAKSLSDTLDISLGRDKSIVIGREKVDDFSKRKTVGTNRVDTRGYDIMVRNKKSQAIKITLFDQVPVAAVSDITVLVKEISKAEHDLQSGELKWKLEIEPQSQVDLKLRYEVKYPKKESIILE